MILASGTITLARVNDGAKGDKGATGATGAKGDPGVDFSQGKMINTDPMFATSSNGCSKYNNKTNTNVTVVRSAKSSDNPMTGTDYELVITTVGEASPGLGGFYQNITSRANAIFIRRIIAKIPVGYTIVNAQNNMGTGYKCEWLTPQAGTGAFTEYIYKYTCGSTGSFSSGGHVYINGTAATADAPVVWYVAYSTTFDMTNESDVLTAQSTAIEAAKTATNYMAFNDVATGLVVGDMTASTLGKNVLIDSDSVDIRNGSTVLASFGANNVNLGRNAQESYIDLCGGAGKISANTAEAATSYPYRNAILIDSQEIETESTRFVSTVSNEYGASTAPNPKKYAEVYLLRESGSSGTTARIKSEHWNTSTGRYINAGFVGLTYDDAAKTYASVYVNDSFNSVYNSMKIYRDRTVMSKPVYIGGVEFSGENKILWSGAWYMSAGHTATLSEAVSDQANGIVLLFSRYSSGTAQDYHFQPHYVPKSQVSKHHGAGHSFLLTSDGSFSLMACKYLYVNDTSIAGNAVNSTTGTGTCGITYTNNGYVLRYVIGV